MADINCFPLTIQPQHHWHPLPYTSADTKQTAKLHIPVNTKYLQDCDHLCVTQAQGEAFSYVGKIFWHTFIFWQSAYQNTRTAQSHAAHTTYLRVVWSLKTNHNSSCRSKPVSLPGFSSILWQPGPHIDWPFLKGSRSSEADAFLSSSFSLEHGAHTRWIHVQMTSISP